MILGIFEFIDYIYQFLLTLESNIHAICDFFMNVITVPLHLLTMIPMFGNMVYSVIPEIAVLGAMSALGLGMIIFNILRDLL